MQRVVSTQTKLRFERRSLRKKVILKPHRGEHLEALEPLHSTNREDPWISAHKKQFQIMLRREFDFYLRRFRA